MQRDIVTDQLNRPIRDLRISVIDRCNFRCPYCMPEEVYGDQFEFIKKDQWLTPDQILKLGRVFNSLGVKKFRITGGEPLLRRDVFEIIQKLKSIDGIEDIALTTNGMYLARSLDNA
jgi:cyclic pyranopterin phosphate synthase